MFSAKIACMSRLSSCSSSSSSRIALRVRSVRGYAVGGSVIGSPSGLRGLDGKEVDAKSLFAGKKVAVVGVPGAFTPVCSTKHVPSFLQNLEKLLKSVDNVAVISVNDHHVMKAWADSLKSSNNKLTFLADPDATFVKRIGLDINLGGAGLGTRSKRYTLLVNDGKITHENVEKSPADFNVTSADVLLKQIAESKK